MYRQIEECRICNDRRLDLLLELGNLSLTGVFPHHPDEVLTSGPLTLVRCANCGLVQLFHSYNRRELYGTHYGYRSSINGMMTKHLQSKAEALMKRVDLTTADVVVDIGSNDGTFLSSFSGKNLNLIGFDPSAAEWRYLYSKDSKLVADFFSADIYQAELNSRKAKIVTSIAMFYDLERPLDFVLEVANILADDGIWHLEQSYLPSMLKMNAYDTICHEHLEYYTLKQIQWMADKAGLKILDVEFNDVNGGSFAVTLSKQRSRFRQNTSSIHKSLQNEIYGGFDTTKPFAPFRDHLLSHKHELIKTLETIRSREETVLGYGASTKGNVILQFAGIKRDLLPAIAEVNEDKFGCFTPGTHIPIISEKEAHSMKPSYFLVFPWHFREGIIQKENSYLRSGGKLIFPLPQVEIVTNP